MMRHAITALLTAQAVLLTLDVWDYRQRCRANPGQSLPSIRAIGFLTFLISIYLVIQVLGGWLMPDPLATLAAVRGYFADVTNMPDDSPGELAIIVIGVVGFYVAGFWDYLIHRFFSHHRWFWFTHEYHHVPREISVFMPGILTRPFGFIPNFLTLIATAGTLYGVARVMGWPAWDPAPLLPALMVIVVVLTASHSSALRRWPWVHKIMRWAWLTTPHEHVLHHAQHLQGNFGNVTTLWDRLAGTYIDPLTVDGNLVALGLPYDQDFLGAITGGQWKISARIRDRFEVGRFCHLPDVPASPTDMLGNTAEINRHPMPHEMSP